MRGLLILVLFTLTTPDIFGQQVIQYDPDVTKYYQEGISHFKDENYKEANRSFRRALSTNKVLPSNLSYYFAETLFHLGQFQNSKNFVDKYLSLTGYSGDFLEEANALSEELQFKFEEIKNCPRCNDSGYRIIPCDQCEASGLEITTCSQCKGLGNSMCPKCTGKGVVITVDTFGQNHYEQCDKCNGTGYVPCELCHGDKVITITCRVCFGTKVRATSIICDHTDNQEEILEKRGVN